MDAHILTIRQLIGERIVLFSIHLIGIAVPFDASQCPPIPDCRTSACLTSCQHAVSFPIASVRLRTPRRCAWVLLALLISWTCAYAAPLVQPANLAVVCSSLGPMRIVDMNSGVAVEDGALDLSGMPECALCLSTVLSAPPSDPSAYASPSARSDAIRCDVCLSPSLGPLPVLQARAPPQPLRTTKR